MTATASKRVSTVGKIRGLQQCATARGALAVLALDHRGSLRRMLHPESPDAATADEMMAFKQQLVKAVAPVAKALLLDPQVGAAQCVVSGALPGHVGLVVAVEATGYTGDPTARHSQVLPGWSVEKSKRMGASAIKLLVYYHPESPTAVEVEALIKEVAADCTTYDIPLFLEVLTYSLDPARENLPSDERRRVVPEAARRLTVIPGVDVLKCEFPLDVTEVADEREWAAACAELSAASAVPWILLSAGVDYDTYLHQVAVACQARASGVAAGRAVWKEAAGLTGQGRADFLNGVVRERLARLIALCDALARPWTEFYATPDAGEVWYKVY